MEFVKFESEREKQALRDWKRECRKRILEKAKDEYEQKQKQKLEKQINEQWMLPSVTERISGGKNHKKAKKNKHKKEKKKNREHKDVEPECFSDSSESDVDEWVEKNAPSATSVPTAGVDANREKKLEHDSWMTCPASSFVPTVSRDELKMRERGEWSAEEKHRRQALDKPGQHERELNPYWKDGGTGLPAAQKSSPATSSNRIGDGGYEWLKRAYCRAKEQAVEENRPLEEIVSERWGSLENLEKLLQEASQKSRSQARCRVDWHRDSGLSTNRMDSGHSGRFRRPDDDDDGSSSYKSRSSRDRHHHLRPTSLSHKRDSRFMVPSENDDECCPSPSLSLGRGHQDLAPTSSLPRWKKEFATAETKPTTRSAKEVHVTDEEAKVQQPAGTADTSKTQTPSPPPPSRPLTEKELNALGAKIVKAELMGNNELASKLKAQLEAAKDVKQQQPERESNEEVVIITRGVSRHGHPPAPSAGRPFSKKPKVETHDRDGLRTRYFADDDKYSLKEMFEHEKLGTAEDQNTMFARLAGKGAAKTTDDFDVDDVFVSRASHSRDEQREKEMAQQRAVSEHKRSSAAVDNCRLCFNGRDTPKHLIVAIGIQTYLMLPSHKSLTSGHCLIIPMQHVVAGTQLDEDVWSEIQVFRKGLTRMFEEQDKDAVFFETSMRLKYYPHMTLQCIPLPKDVGHQAPMYFKKAILESETEWTNNKKLVDLTERDVRRAVPKGLPYFSVNFGLEGGFAHVIEDERLFPRNFAQEIIGGMVDSEPNLWRRPARETFEEQRKKVLQFAEWWKPFDWTRKLKE